MLVLKNVAIQYDKNVVVKGINLELKKGQLGCLLGPSGCGKTSILKAIAGFQSISDGHISLRGTEVSQVGKSVAPEKRHVAVVFQDFALFPHLTVGQNIAFGLHKKSKVEKEQRVSEVLALIDLTEYESRYPHQISGGQQQRVALARALAPQPDLILFDEPFSSLDAELRSSLAMDIREILKAVQTTALLVTHDQHEAFAMADVIGVINQGELHQFDTAYQLYHQPNSQFVAEFIGQGAFISGLVKTEHTVNTALGLFKSEQLQNFLPEQKVKVLVRPDDIIHDDQSPIQAKVLGRAFQGSHILYTLSLTELGTETLLCLAPSHHDHAIGESFGIRLELDHIVCF